MSRSVKEIAGIAGLLEGEGCFSEQKNVPRLTIAMIDLDVMERVRDILDKSKKLSPYTYDKVIKGETVKRTIYKLTLTGGIAIQ
jgi:hypothetical protein